MPPYAEVDAVQWPENAPALLYAAKIARTPYYLARGPEGRGTSSRPLGPGWQVIWSVVDDSGNGNDNIRFSFYSIDAPYWAPGFAPRWMRPLDGANDSPIEVNFAFVDTSGLSAGRHIVFTHGIDAAGNLGPASAVFIDVP